MENIKKHLFGLVFCLIIFFGLILPVGGFGQGKCLIVSDIHLDLGKNQNAKQVRHEDSNLGLLISSLSEMKKQLDKPDFIVIAGDFVGHNIPDKDKVHTINVIAQLFHKTFGEHIKIIAALGNNDSDKGDYAIQPASFLDAFAKAWRLKENLGVDVQAFKKANGCYTAEIKPSAQSESLRFVVINTTLISHGATTRGYNYSAEGNQMLTHWLPSHLAASTKPVWIISHIPPGEDIEKKFEDKLITKVTDPQYAARIKFYIAGHTHFNDFRVIYDQKPNKPQSAQGFVRIVPSISPDHDNNPSFIKAEYLANGSIKQETPYYFDLNDFTWKSNYGISTVELPDISATGMLNYIFSKKDPHNDPGYYRFHSLDSANRDSYMKKNYDNSLLKL